MMSQENLKESREAQMEAFFEKEKLKFEMPELFEHKIRYVENRDDADIMVSCNHTLGDYIILGVVALERSIFQKKSTTIKVYNQRLHEDKMTIYHCNYCVQKPFCWQKHYDKSSEKVIINLELYLQNFNDIDRIYSALYKGKTKVRSFGYTIAYNLPINLTGEGNIGKEFFKKMKFENFADLLSAQKNSLDLIIESFAGFITALYFGEID